MNHKKEPQLRLPSEKRYRKNGGIERKDQGTVRSRIQSHHVPCLQRACRRWVFGRATDRPPSCEKAGGFLPARRKLGNARTDVSSPEMGKRVRPNWITRSPRRCETASLRSNKPPLSSGSPRRAARKRVPSIWEPRSSRRCRRGSRPAPPGDTHTPTASPSPRIRQTLFDLPILRRTHFVRPCRLFSCRSGPTASLGAGNSATPVVKDVLVSRNESMRQYTT